MCGATVRTLTTFDEVSPYPICCSWSPCDDYGNSSRLLLYDGVVPPAALAYYEYMRLIDTGGADVAFACAVQVCEHMATALKVPLAVYRRDAARFLYFLTPTRIQNAAERGGQSSGK